MGDIKNLERIINRSDSILKAIDDFWNHAKTKGWLENDEFMNSVMFMEHEVSRSCEIIKAHANAEIYNNV